MLFWQRLKTLPASWLIASLVLLTLILRLPLLNGSFWLDEAAQILESARPWSQQLQIRDDFQPPFLHLLTFVTRHISVNEAWLRLWGALIPSLIVTWVMLSIVAEWWQKNTPAYKTKALWLGLLLATNSLWVFYSQELRPYSLAVMWTALSWWAIVRITKHTPNQNQISPLNWAGWALSVLGGLYSTYLFPFVLISQVIYLGWQAYLKPKLWQNFIISSLVVALGFAPWIPSFLGQLEAGQQLRVDLPGWEKVVSTSQFKSLPLAMGKFLFGVVDLDLNIYYLGLASLVLSLFLWLGWQFWHQHQAKKLDSLSRATLSALLVMAWWVIVPIVLAWLISFRIPVIQPKRILFVLPALYGLAVMLATEVNFSWKKLRLGQLALLSLLFINIWSLAEYYRQPTYQRENWREVHSRVLRLAPPDKTLAVFAFSGPFAGWQWYDQNQYDTLNLGYLTPANTIDVTNELKSTSDKYTYVLVFEYLESLTDPAKTVKAALHSLGWREIHAVSQPGVGFVRIYVQPNNLLVLTTPRRNSL